MSDPAPRLETAPRPGYRFTVEPHPHRVRVECAGLVLADSDDVLVLRETRLPPVFYFPRADVRTDLLEPSGYRTHCPFKGNAEHFSLRHGDTRVENVAWSYEDPLPEAREIARRIAFYPDRVDAIHDEGGMAAVEAFPGYANPLLGWLLHQAPAVASAEALTDAFARTLRGAGVAVARLFVVLRTLHPQVVGRRYLWSARTGAVETLSATRDGLERPEYRNSPIRAIFEGAGGIRRRLDVPEPVLDYGILRDLHREGATDYVALPMPFSDGTIHALTMTSDRPGGFTTAELGHVYEVLGVLGRLYEAHAARHTTLDLLETYLGRHAAERVLDGRVQRGDGEDIRAVIWFCDLRDSTPLARSMSRAQFLLTLNDYFDALAGAVLAHRGQVLRFIGDAALAIFPIEDPDCGWAASECLSAERARAAALAAVDDARRRVAETNARRAAAGRPAIAFGLALHEGEVTYGNIGTAERLEFTVIGDAANCAARIESLCRTLGEPVLASAEIAAHYPERFRSLGVHALRGVDAPRELFALR